MTLIDHSIYTQLGAAPSLWQYAARMLCGYPVAVYFSAPAENDLGGCARRTPAGQAFIRIDPDYNEEDRFMIFLHECGHCREHSARLPEQATSLPPRSLGTPAAEMALDLRKVLEWVRDRDPQYRRDEDEAQGLADRWAELAARALGEGASTLARLQWLLDSAYDNPLFAEEEPTNE